MTNKVQKIIAEIKDRISNYQEYIDSGYDDEEVIKQKELKDLLTFIDSLQEEPVSEDDENALNSVAITFLQEQQIVPNFYADIIMKAVKRGANWQKQQMMKDAIDVEIVEGVRFGQCHWSPKIVLWGQDHNFKLGDRAKVIVIKED